MISAMTTRSWLATGTALALGLVLAVSGSAQASTKKPKEKVASSSFTVSGQVAGTLAFNKAETCASGNASVSDGIYTIRVWLTDHGVKPTKATWALVIEATVGQTPYPAVYPNEVTLSATSPTGPVLGTWSAGGVVNTPSGSGTLTIAPKAKGGSLAKMVLSPSTEDPGTATSAVTVTGKWAC
jgi:hypothetical protein